MKKNIVTADIDIEIKEDGKLSTSGVAYYRLDKGMKDFLAKCNEKGGIVGFEYEHDSFNFGVILADKKEKK